MSVRSLKARRPLPQFKSTIPGTISYRIVQTLPEPYKKFWKEWTSEPVPVHWTPSTARWVKTEKNEVKIVRDRPIPVRYPYEIHEGIWGGEGVVDGLVKKRKYACPVPWNWVPHLKTSVLYSELLNTYFSLIVTQRTLDLVHEANGFDSYLLNTSACNLQSLLALKIKRRALLALLNKDFHKDDLEKQEALYNKYKHYLIPEEEIEWYGLSVEEAAQKHSLDQEKIKNNSIRPLKHEFRQLLIQKLSEEKEEKLTEDQKPPEKVEESWLKKLNPFSKPEDKK